MMHKPSVLITGATGYVGSHVAARFEKAGWQVHALIRPTSDLHLLSPLRNTIETHVVPEDAPAFNALLRKIRPEVVIHLASLFVSEHDPSQVPQIIESNVLFGTRLLEAMVAAGTKHFINTSSYWTHYQGSDYLPANLYAATKQAFCDILEYYLDAYGMRAVTLELCDTYGPNDPRPKILNFLRRVAERGETLAMSPGLQELDFVHVNDVANAYVTACQGLLDGQWDRHAMFAVRTGRPISLRKLVSIIETATERQLPIEWGGRPYRAREVMTTYTPLPTLPDWRPRQRFESFAAGWLKNMLREAA